MKALLFTSFLLVTGSSYATNIKYDVTYLCDFGMSMHEYPTLQWKYNSAGEPSYFKLTWRMADTGEEIGQSVGVMAREVRTIDGDTQVVVYDQSGGVLGFLRDSIYTTNGKQFKCSEYRGGAE